MSYTFLNAVPPFCEGKLNGYGGPEYYNSISSLVMSLWTIGRVIQYSNAGILMKDVHFIYSMLFLNCIYSSVFHWNLNAGWKMFDESTMIIPLWIGMQFLLRVVFDSNRRSLKQYLFCTHFINSTILVINSFPEMQWIFPYTFTFELIVLGYFYTLLRHQVPDEHNHGYNGVSICTMSGILWWITETFCHRYLRYGHLVWHIGMPVGVDFIIQYVLEAYKRKCPCLLKESVV